MTSLNRSSSVRVDVRVQLAREPAVGLLDLVRRGVARRRRGPRSSPVWAATQPSARICRRSEPLRVPLPSFRGSPSGSGRPRRAWPPPRPRAVADAHDRRGRQPLVRVLVTDAYGEHRLVPRLAEQPQQHDLLLQRLEHRPDASAGSRDRTGQVGRAAEDDPLLVLLDQASRAGRTATACTAARSSAVKRSGSSGQPAGASASRRPHDGGVELRTQLDEQVVGNVGRRSPPLAARPGRCW